ncbi:VOC family protein [Pseudovibrio ascidiaceicola]|uniref:VOC family protein n=1 Tax=Pseudovibrio TaxID=258255 RepID=UPI0007AE4A4E|nr:VOC family protein [Pseudovibrio sp. Ad26]KZL13254.1 Glyoxalase/Bleomycin resistance protein/Dioxygenase superfamily protein [Pseudovibrio sp. Ad26]
MKIYITSVFVDDQQKALEFYTEKLGFEKKNDVPLGESRWLTVISKEDENSIELLLEPSSHPAVSPFKKALAADGIPAASFSVEDLDKEHQRLETLGVNFVQAPSSFGDVKLAVFDDTCGNLIQLVQLP